MEFSNPRRPLQKARKAKAWLAAHRHMWKFGRHGRRRYRGDPRYDLQNVTKGFMSSMDESSHDTGILERICEAYSRAVKEQQSSPTGHDDGTSWRRVPPRPLAAVIQALLEKDTVALSRMYRNFYRDPCSSELLRAPYGMSNVFFSGAMKDIYRHFYLSHVLYRLDYWSELTNRSFPLSDLASPGVGNPFGVVIDGTHIAAGSEYAHYCAHRVLDLVLPTASPVATLAEIGGGFGGMAYYLLRRQQPLRYLNFDVPESVALSSYYLMKAFPSLRFLLFGEKQLTNETISQSDVVLMPNFQLEAMPAGSVDLTFSSYVLSGLSQPTRSEYLKNALRMTKQFLLYIGDQGSSDEIAGLVRKQDASFMLADTRSSGWRSHKVSGAGVGGAAALADSMSSEQCFVRTAPSSRLPAMEIALCR